MSDEDDLARGARLRQRLWGAAVLIALLVIVLPMVLDGSGSESRFRRVERLREEPPRLVDAEAPADAKVDVATDSPTDAEPDVKPDAEPDTGPDMEPGARPDAENGAETDARPMSDPRVDPPDAWVVQAGSFAHEDNALAVRDRLRRAGYPSFVTETDVGDTRYRVRVGPMVDPARARAARARVTTLLGRDAVVTRYP